MYRGFAAPESSGSRPHGGAVLYDVFPQQDRPLDRITFHTFPSPLSFL